MVTTKTKLTNYFTWLVVAICGQRSNGESLTQVARIPDDFMIIPSCPDPMPIEGSSCDTPFECTMDYFCCPEDATICVPKKSCYCDKDTSSVACYDTYYPIICPSMCPTTRPETNDTCSLDIRFLCNYGNSVSCSDVDIKFDSERQCQCSEGVFWCSDAICPVTCPATQPEQGDKCLPFIPGYCDYGSFCCPGDGSKCVSDKSCYCEENSSYCYQPFVSLPCPSVCPKTPPQNMDSCDIDSRFQCNYGDAFTCENEFNEYEGLSFSFKKQCICYNGTFSCYNNTCPELCPDVEPVPGTACLPFVNYSCNYDEYCCDGTNNKNCVPMRECYCDYDLKVICYEPSIYCPSVCPEIKPENGQACNLEERLVCNYNEESEKCLRSECSCVQGVYICNKLCSKGNIGMGQGSTNIASDNSIHSSSDNDDKNRERGKKQGQKEKKPKNMNVGKKSMGGKKGKKQSKKGSSKFL